jgi:hypothetical protein
VKSWGRASGYGSPEWYGLHFQLREMMYDLYSLKNTFDFIAQDTPLRITGGLEQGVVGL